MVFYQQNYPSVVTADDVTQGFHLIVIPIGEKTRIIAAKINPKTRDTYGTVQYALKRQGGQFASIGPLSFLEFNVGHTWQLDLPFGREEAVVRLVIWKPLVAADIVNSALWLEDEHNDVRQ